jgi:hypothetical protein
VEKLIHPKMETSRTEDVLQAYPYLRIRGRVKAQSVDEIVGMAPSHGREMSSVLSPEAQIHSLSISAGPKLP